MKLLDSDQIDDVAADSITLKNHAGSSTIAVSANEDSTTYGESTCGNFQLWGNSATGIRALDGQENILSSSASYTIASQSCLDPISSISNHWDTKFVSATNDVFLTSKIPLVYTGVNSCKKYRVVLSGKVVVGLWVCGFLFAQIFFSSKATDFLYSFCSILYFLLLCVCVVVLLCGASCLRHCKRRLHVGH